MRDDFIGEKTYKADNREKRWPSSNPQLKSKREESLRMTSKVLKPSQLFFNTDVNKISCMKDLRRNELKGEMKMT